MLPPLPLLLPLVLVVVGTHSSAKGSGFGVVCDKSFGSFFLKARVAKSRKMVHHSSFLVVEDWRWLIRQCIQS